MWRWWKHAVSIKSLQWNIYRLLGTNKVNIIVFTKPTPVETRPAQRAVRVRAPGEARREEDEAHLRSMLDRLKTLEAIAEAREPIDSNDQLQKRILEDMRVLRRDVNTILEDHSQSDRRQDGEQDPFTFCLLYTSPSPRDQRGSRMPSSA